MSPPPAHVHIIGPMSEPLKKQQRQPSPEPDDRTSSSSRSRSRSRSPRGRRALDDDGIKEVLLEPSPEPRCFDFRTPFEWFSFFLGLAILLTLIIPVGSILFAALLWEAVDRGFDGGFTQSNKELSGFLCARVAPAITRATQNFNQKFVKKPQDAYMVNSMVLHGVFVPLMFSACAWRVYTTGVVELWLVFGYHFLRIGPFFMNFAFVYTLCHKEGHARFGLFKEPYNSSTILRNWYNWWIGMFYGVLPATFAYGHSINHHKYNNGPLDVVTTSDKPRDSFANWVAYLPRWFTYACNLTTVIQFLAEGNYKIALKVVWGSLYSFIWVGFCAKVFGSFFSLAYVVFPFFEAGLLLAAVNWSWHAFIDPADPENEYVQSITIFGGSINVLNEDAHVVHHQVPGCHWTDHPNHVERHWEAYRKNRASVFRHTHAFEIFGMAVAADYDALAEKFVDLDGEASGKPLSKEQRVELMKQRLRACWWGPRADPKWAKAMSSRVDPRSTLKAKTH